MKKYHVSKSSMFWKARCFEKLNVLNSWMFWKSGWFEKLDVKSWMFWKARCFEKLEVVKVWKAGCFEKLDFLKIWMFWKAGCFESWMFWTAGCSLWRTGGYSNKPKIRHVGCLKRSQLIIVLHKSLDPDKSGSDETGSEALLTAAQQSLTFRLIMQGQG